LNSDFLVLRTSDQLSGELSRFDNSQNVKMAGYESNAYTVVSAKPNRLCVYP